MVPLPLIAVAVGEALQAPAPPMVLSEVAFVHCTILVGGLASPAGSRTAGWWAIAPLAVWLADVDGQVSLECPQSRPDHS